MNSTGIYIISGIVGLILGIVWFNKKNGYQISNNSNSLSCTYVDDKGKLITGKKWAGTCINESDYNFLNLK